MSRSYRPVFVLGIVVKGGRGGSKWAEEKLLGGR